MPDFKPTEDIISMSEFRNTLANCAARTHKTHRPIFLTQDGRASAVFLDAADWEKFAEKLYNASLYEDILTSEGEIRARRDLFDGRSPSHDRQRSQNDCTHRHKIKITSIKQTLQRFDAPYDH